MRTCLGLLGFLSMTMASGSVRSKVLDLLETPQVKVDRVQIRGPSDWRAFLSAIDEHGTPVSLAETGVRLFLSRVDGKGSGANRPEWAFRPGGLPDRGYRGRLRPIGEAAVEQAVIFVVSAHAGIPREVAAQSADLVQRVAKGLRKDARVGVLVYQDHLWASRGTPDAPWLGDLNERQGCLEVLRATADPFGTPPAEGECGGLLPGAESWKGLSFPAPQGVFPRFLGIPEDEEVLEAARSLGQTALDHRPDEVGGTAFAQGAVEAALRWLAIASPRDGQGLVVVLSDGRDGYLGVADLFAARHTPRCQAQVDACRSTVSSCQGSRRSRYCDPEGSSAACSRGVMECVIPRVARDLQSREEAVRERLRRLVILARALGVQIHVLAVPGTDAVGRSRLEALALRTGGGYWEAADLPGLEDAAAGLAASLSRQTVLEPRKSLEEGVPYRIMASWEGVESGWFPVLAGSADAFWIGSWERLRRLVLGRLGHDWGPPALWTGMVVVLGMVLAILWMLGKGGKALVMRVARPARSRKPPSPGMPVLRRPVG